MRRSSDAIGCAITPAPAADWKTTNPNSPPCASRMMNTGRSGTGNGIRRAIVHSTPALTQQEPEHDGGDHERPVQHDREVDRHADGDEEEAEQQALERFDVGLEFAPVFALGKQHAGEEGTERHRQADRLHQRGRRDHQQQRCRGEDFGRLAGAIQRSVGRSSKRPPSTIAAITPMALIAPSQPSPLAWTSVVASNGTRARIGIAATSCSSATLSTLWPSRWSSDCARPARRDRWP